MSVAVSAVVRPSRLFAMLSLLMGVMLLAAAAMLDAQSSGLHHALAVPCVIAAAFVILFPLCAKKSFRIDVTGIGQIRLVDTSLEAEAELTDASISGGEVVQLLRGSTFWSSLMVLRLQTESGRNRVLIILPDSMACDAFHALSVACRWVAASHSRSAVMPSDFSPRSD